MKLFTYFISVFFIAPQLVLPQGGMPIDPLSATSAVAPISLTVEQFLERELQQLSWAEQVLMVWSTQKKERPQNPTIDFFISKRIRKIRTRYYEAYPLKSSAEFKQDWRNTAQKLRPKYVRKIPFLEPSVSVYEQRHSFHFKIEDEEDRRYFVKAGKTVFGVEQVFREAFAVPALCRALQAKGLLEPAKTVLGLDEQVQLYLFKNGNDYYPAVWMHLIDGVSLNRYLKTKPQPGLNQQVAWCLKLVQAALFFKKAGYYYRDFSDENILITPSGQIQFIDFGLTLSKNEYHQNYVPWQHSYNGSFPYISPVLMRGTQRTFHEDIWALGVLLYQIVQWEEAPFGINETTKEDPYKVLQKINQALPLIQPEDFSEEPLIADLARIIQKMMWTGPFSSYRLLEEVERDLLLLAEKLPVPLAGPAPSFGQTHAISL